MHYLVIGAGATGGCIAGYLQQAQKQVTLIARGANLTAINEQGLTIHRINDQLHIPVHAVSEQAYAGKADVIFVCVKYYSLEEMYDLIRRASHESTIVIPVLNVYGTGEKMAESLAPIEVLNGCIYIASALEAPGVIKQSGEIFRIVYGRLDGNTEDARLQQIKQDLAESHIMPILSSDVRKDTLQKFTFVSCMAAAGYYYKANAAQFKQKGKARDLFIACIEEVNALAKAMDICLPENIVALNLDIMHSLDDEMTTSLQKDLQRGGRSEAEGLIAEVVRMGKHYGVAVPMYARIAEALFK